MKTISQHSKEFKDELDELLQIFGFKYRVGDLTQIFYNDVYFIKDEIECYHNLSISDNIPFGCELKDSIDNYTINIKIHTNYKIDTYKADISEKCSSIEELYNILKRRFPKDWNHYKRKNIFKILGN